MRVINSATAYSENSFLGTRERKNLPLYPTILIGDNIPWQPNVNGKCSACQEKPMRLNEYCIKCDRWGMDSLREVMHRVSYYHKPANLGNLKERVADVCQSMNSKSPKTI